MLSQILSSAIVDLLPEGLPKSVSMLGKAKFLDSNPESIERESLAIIGICEDRNSLSKGSSLSPNIIRQYLYSLSGAPVHKNIWDLGNIANTNSPSDTYAALRLVIELALEKELTLIVLGGTQELTYPIYQALSNREKGISITIVDSKVDLEPNSSDFSPSSFLNPISEAERERLYCLNLIGFQGYLTNHEAIRLLESKHHELYRLGYLRNSIQEVEPAFRNSQITSFDLSSIRQSDCPSTSCPTPNGLYAEEACQLSRFAGLSSKMKIFGLFEHNFKNDNSGQSAHLAAQMVWHFIEGFYSRKKEGKNIQNRKYKRFFIKSPIPNVNMVFLKDIVTQSWWLELSKGQNKGNETIIVACSHSDYIAASKGDVPERWLRASSRMI